MFYLLTSRKQRTVLRRGFSLIELLLVVSIIMAISAAGIAGYRNFGKHVELSSTREIITADLRQAQSKAMAGEGGVKWGAHFVNNDASQYYELFSTGTVYGGPSAIVYATTSLAGGVVFSDPLPGMNKDILFERITGMTSVDSTISVTSENVTESVTVKTVGAIY